MAEMNGWISAMTLVVFAGGCAGWNLWVRACCDLIKSHSGGRDTLRTALSALLVLLLPLSMCNTTPPST